MTARQTDDASATDDGYRIANLKLPDDHYTVEQSLVRNKYKATDAAGNVVLRGKQKMFKLKEEFPFEDGDGNDVFTIKAGGILDVAGDYTLVDAATGDPVVTLDRNYSIFEDVWKLRDPRTEAKLAEIRSRSKLLEVLRSFVGVANLVPEKYDITDLDGRPVGSIEGQFSLKDRYEINVGDTRDVPREPLVAAAMVIDAIEGN